MLKERVRDSLSRHRAVWLLLLVVRNLEEHHAIAAASAIAFDAFLSLVPLTAILGFALYRVHQSAALEGALGPLGRLLPHGVGELVGHEFLRLSSGSAAILAPVSLGAFVWVLSAGVSTAMYVFEVSFATTPRPWWKRRLLALGFVIGATVVLALVGATTLSISALWDLRVRPVVAIVVSSLTVLGLVTAFLRLSIPRRPGRRFLPGALLTVILWLLSSGAFSWYVVRLSRFTTLYGNLATVAVLLVWLWLLALSLLVGGELNHELAIGREREARETGEGTAESAEAPRR